MRDFILLFIASSFITSAFVYWWWTTVRVAFFRQEIFQIRNDLWRFAMKSNALEDPGYRACRKHLNNIIKTASILSVESMELFFQLSLKDPSMLSAGSSPCRTSKMQEAVDEAKTRAFSLVVSYIMFQRASGWAKVMRLTTEHLVKIAAVWMRGTFTFPEMPAKLPNTVSGV